MGSIVGVLLAGREQPADLSAMLADVHEPIVLTEVLYGWDDIDVLLR